ncbi:hypothetical protein B0J18DRAFT_223633 [Chaetomium sp. MPI-SDFR-AT-0129]|nr:hypothetical protein B0J18DRAFT_223633 [Chaetomium sp. MPI-SDFR-AT-0129]
MMIFVHGRPRLRVRRRSRCARRGVRMARNTWEGITVVMVVPLHAPSKPISPCGPVSRKSQETTQPSRRAPTNLALRPGVLELSMPWWLYHYHFRREATTGPDRGGIDRRLFCDTGVSEWCLASRQARRAQTGRDGTKEPKTGVRYPRPGPGGALTHAIAYSTWSSVVVLSCRWKKKRESEAIRLPLDARRAQKTGFGTKTSWLKTKKSRSASCRTSYKICYLTPLALFDVLGGNIIFASGAPQKRKRPIFSARSPRLSTT